MSSPQPAPTATILPAGSTDAEGLPVLPDQRIRHNDRTGTVKSVRPGSGVLIFADDLDGKQKTALISEVVHVPADEPVPTPGDLHRPDAPAANAVEVDPRLADIQAQVDGLRAAGDPQCEFSLPKTQKCAKCDQQATKRVIWAEGMAYQPTCEEHLAQVTAELEKEYGSEVDAVRDIPAVTASADEFVAAPGPCSLDRSAKHNWVEDVGGLPNYICQIARAVARGGKTLDSAIPIAVSTVKKWAAGAGNVSAAVRARAAAAVLEWEAKKARARANGVESAVLATEVLETLAVLEEQEEFALEFTMDTYHLLSLDPDRTFEADFEVNAADGELEVKPGTDLPPQKPSAARKARNYKRYPPGHRDGLGGQFAPGKARNQKAAKAQKDAPSKSLYNRVLSAGPKQAKVIVAELPDNDLKKLTEIIYSSDEIDPQVAAGRLVVKQEMKRRGLEVKDHGAPEGGKAKGTSQDPVQRDEKQPGGDDPNSRPDNPAAPAIGSQDILIPAPSTHNGIKMTGGPYEDGSARYSDGYVWDPIAGQFRKSVAQKSKASGTENGLIMPITASAAEYRPEEFNYFWDPDTSETFRVSADGTKLDVFAPVLDEQAEPAWQSVRLDGETAERVTRLPAIDDEATLESVLGAAFIDEDAQVEALVAAAVAAHPDVETPEGAGKGQGRQFRIPVVIPAGVPSGDRRTVAPGALESKELPMPLLWQRETDEGHKRSVIVGRIDAVEELESGGLGNARGVFDIHPDAVEAARQVEGRFLTGVSGDLDFFDFSETEDETGKPAMHITKGRLVAATLVAKPAFQEATIELIGEDGAEMPPAITAAGGPLKPPAEWFQNPKLDGPTMLTVEPDGRVYGHIAEWGTPHLGNPRLQPPKSKQGYRYFNRKPVETAEGIDVRTGQLTLMGGHASIDMDPDMAVKHYDDTRSAVADVVAGEDEFGVWVSGAMRPGLSDNQLRAFRASEPSGDWRMRDGNLELCAVCQVNVAGFPVNARPRAMVASGEVVALVAAGMVGYAEQRSSTSAQIESLQQQISAIIAEQETQKKAALAQIIQTALAQI